MSDIITALKRLERAGSEDSRETQKLLRAAELLAEHIAAMLPPEASQKHQRVLPRNYAEHGGSLLSPLGYDAGHRGNLVSDNRAVAEDFARDVASGWLDELANWLEARTVDSAEAGATLRRAAEAMR